MERIKGIIADDEVHILKNLCNVIPWQDIGIDIVATAKNGEEALTHFYAYEPEFVLCDIRMPGMDGISFIKELNKSFENCEIIMLTAYNDFEYMRSSIQYGVRDYLLKPIDYDELQKVVERAASNIRNQKLKAVMEKRKWDNLSYLAHEKNLHDALMGYVPSAPWLWEDRQDQEAVYQLFVVDMDRYLQKARFWDDEDHRLWNFAVKNVLSEALQGYDLSYTVLQMREGEWCVLIEQRLGASPSLRKWADKLVADVNQYLKLQINVGSCQSPISIDQLSGVYKMIQRDLHLALNKNENPLVLADDVFRDGNDIDVFLWDKVEMMVSGLKKGDRHQSWKAVKDLQTDLQSLSESSFVHVEQILHYLSLHLLREMKALTLIDDREEESVWKDLKYSTGNEDVMNVIQGLVRVSMDEMARKKNSESMMIAAEDYMQRNIEMDIGINDMAEHLGISPSYFSMLFKRHFNETFVEYLTRQRMEKAKTLMMTTSLSIAKIAKQLGYTDRRYFSKVFQKYAGMIPSAFREQ